MRVLVTGAGGFVGRAVVQRLAQAGWKVTGLLHRPTPAETDQADVTTAVADLRDRERIRRLVEEGQFEAVCHLAALTNGRESLEHPLPYFDHNVGGVISLLRALDHASRRHGRWVRFVFASSHAVYGNPDVESPVTEYQAPRPINAYGASKLAAEQLIAFQAATGSLGAISLRCFNVAGAVGMAGDQDLTRVIPQALAVAAGKASYFPLNGDGSAVREFVHVADVADAFLSALKAARQGEHSALNIGSGIGISMRQLLTEIERHTGRSLAVQALPPKPEARIVVADISRALQRLGWSPARSAVETIIRDAWAVVRSAGPTGSHAIR